MAFLTLQVPFLKDKRKEEKKNKRFETYDTASVKH